MIRSVAYGLCLFLASVASFAQVERRPDAEEFACKPLMCSTLLPASSVDDVKTNDCGYQNGNAWWLDHVAGSLAWSDSQPVTHVTVAVFDDGADIAHPDLRKQLWTNSAEANGKPGVDDDSNGYVDDLHGWDFVDDDATVAPEGECQGRLSHGTFMASLVAAERNNRVGIAAAGSDGARVMVIRMVGCRGQASQRADPARLIRALDYATRMGAKILSFSAHWNVTTPELDAAFAAIADRADTGRAAIIVASVPNKGEATAGYPAAYSFTRMVRAIPISNDNAISPGTTSAPAGRNLGAPSACVIGAAAPPFAYRMEHGSSNSTAILSGLLAGIWSTAAYAKFPVDEFLARVVDAQMLKTSRRSQPALKAPYLEGVPLADACMLATSLKNARVCTPSPEPQRESRR